MDHEDIVAITEYITKGVYPRGISKGEKRSLRKRCHSFSLKNGVLYHHGNKHKKQRLVVSDPQERVRILDTMHRDSDGRPTHNGIKFTHRKVTDWYWWRGITEDVKTFCKRCPECSQLAVANPNRHSEPEDSDSNREPDPVEPFCITPIAVVEHREMTSTSHSSDLVTSLRRLFEEKVGFDVVLTAGGFQASAHKVIVMATSDYLKSLIVDHDQLAMDQSTIQLTNISGLCLEPIVTFLYTGTLRLSQENVHLMSAAASQLGITSAVALCQQFLANDATSEERSAERDVDIKNDESEASSDTKSFAPTPFPSIPEGTNCNSVNDLLILNIKEEVPTVPMVNLEDFVASVSTPRLTCVNRSLPPNCFVSLGPSVSTPRLKSNNPVGRSNSDRSSSRSIRYSTRSAVLRKILPKPKPRFSRAEEYRRRELQKSRRTAMAKALLNTHGRRHACYVCESVFEFASGLKHHQWMRHGILRLDLALYRLSQMSVRAAIRSILRRGSSRRKPAEEEIKPPGKSSSKKSSTGKVPISKKTPGKPYLSDETSKVCPETLADAAPALEHPLKKTPSKSGAPPSHSGSIFNMWTRAVRYERLKCKSPKNCGATALLQIFRNKCGWCGRTFLRRADLLEHRKMFHKSRKKPAGFEPEKRHRNDWSCSEKGCDARPKSKEELKDHMSTAHPNVFLSCPNCRYKTQVDHYLKRHLAKRHRERHICPICSRSYHKMCLLRIHMYNQHKVEDPSLKLEHCPHEGCNYACPGKWALKTHMLKHSPSKPFTCDKCGRDFKRALSLEKHINKIHLGIRGYICDKCGGSFSDESELKRHAIRHDKNMAFVCAKCPFQSYIKAAFQSHMFSRHQVIVNNRMQLFKCDQCSFATDRRHRYTEHVKKHANIRDIPCPECGKLFVTYKTMRQHIVKVHKQTTIYCALCPFRTLSQTKLNEHVALMHDLQGEIDPTGSLMPDHGGPSTSHPVGALSHSNAVSSSLRNLIGGSSHRNATRASAHPKAASASRADVDVSPCSIVSPPSGNVNSAQLPYSDVGPTLYTEAGPSPHSVVRPLMLGSHCATGFPSMLPPGCEVTGIPMSIDNTFCRFSTFNGGSSVR